MFRASCRRLSTGHLRKVRRAMPKFPGRRGLLAPHRHGALRRDASEARHAFLYSPLSSWTAVTLTCAAFTKRRVAAKYAAALPVLPGDRSEFLLRDQASRFYCADPRRFSSERRFRFALLGSAYRRHPAFSTKQWGSWRPATSPTPLPAPVGRSGQPLAQTKPEPALLPPEKPQSGGEQTRKMLRQWR